MKKSAEINGLRACCSGALLSRKEAIIADLHLGYESAMEGSGVFLPRVQLQDIMSKLEQLPKRGTIIINGDLKHDFGRVSAQEWDETHRLLSWLEERYKKVVIVRGNHDNYLMSVASKYEKVEFIQDALETKEFIVAHGHRDTPAMHSKKLRIIAHEHPSVSLRDDVGVSVRMPCFLYSRDLIVMPAFSPLAAGTDVAKSRQSGLLSPVLRRVGIEKMRAVAIDPSGCVELPEVGLL